MDSAFQNAQKLIVFSARAMKCYGVVVVQMEAKLDSSTFFTHLIDFLAFRTLVSLSFKRMKTNKETNEIRRNVILYFVHFLELTSTAATHEAIISD